MTKLTELFLNNNKLTQLPESIGNLTQLTRLELVKNKLTQLPESIGNLTQLLVLYLENNQLTQLPESIGNLTQLKTLHLNNNQLTQLPESIGKLTQLIKLILNNNPINTLPSSILNLRNTSITPEDYHKFIPTPSIPSIPSIPLSNSDITIDTSQMGMDMIEGEVRISDFLAESPSNLVIQSVGQNNYILTSHETIQHVLTDATFYKCKEATGYPRLDNIDKTRPLFQFNALGLNIGFGYLSEIHSVLNSTNQYFGVVQSEETVIAVVSKNVLENGGTWVSANHCQSLGSNLPVYHLVLASATTTNAGLVSGGAARSLVERDKTLSAIQSVLYRKKKLLMNKFQQLKENVKDNEYLNEITNGLATDIYEDIPAKQLEILYSLNTYIQSIIGNGLETGNIESAKYDQQLILSKIAELKHS